MSSKGQIVIPKKMRKGIKEGDKMIIIKNGKQIILKKASSFDEQLAKDLEFARKTEEAYRSYERGEFIEMDFDDFLKKAKKW